MHPTRITVIATLALAAIACGIDAVGTQIVGASDPSSTPDAAASDAAPSDERDASTGTIEEDAAIGFEDAAVDDGGADAGILDAQPDAPLPTTTLDLKYANAPATVNLTTEGTIDWAYWGANGITTPARKTAPNVISTLGIVYNEFGATANGFGTTFSWTNASSGSGSSDGYLYVKSSVGLSETVKMPSGPTPRTAVIWVGGNGIRGKLSVRLVDGGTTLTKSDASHESANVFGVQYTITFSSILPSSLEVTWELDQTYGVNSLRFAAVALR